MPINQRIVSDESAAAAAAADFIIERVKSKPDLVLGLATGGTVIPLYQELIRRCNQGAVDFSRVRTFNLDEYAGLPASHDQSYRFFMNQQLFSKINIPAENTHVLNGVADDLNEECRRYEQAIAEAGGLDVQLLGIGRNGHIAFNEPGSPRGSLTRVVDLSEDTIAANSDGRFFKDAAEVPRQALTMGIQTIMAAKEILLIATGAGKANAVALAIRQAPAKDVPASLLQTHPSCTFIIDRLAAGELQKV